MAAYKKQLPTSRALRPGGEGTVPPSKSDSDVFNLGSMKGPKETGPSGPTKIGKGVSMPKIPKAPSAPKMLKAPTGIKQPKQPKFR